ncbi:SGNH/GDSL hydrolase family protein [Flagellimonas marina]|uniref:SGNH/GDSL hydrolase family protein n=1 Tax=Flagellimonas marina TaxID=1775168 RepID=A0ABV8PS55_9FLAO
MKKIFILLTFILSIVCVNAQLKKKQSDADKDKKEGLHADGGSWGFKPATDVNENDSMNILLIGDSILKGYGRLVTDNLKNKAKVDFWITGKHLNSDGLLEELREYVSKRKYDVIHFNIGLHGWQVGRIPEGQYVPLLEKYVQTLKEYAPQAKLIWANTTPVTEHGSPVLNDEINPTIIARNALAAEVMKRNEVVINDLYTMLVNRLILARLDRFHWNEEGYRLMANQISDYLLKELE